MTSTLATTFPQANHLHASSEAHTRRDGERERTAALWHRLWRHVIWMDGQSVTAAAGRSRSSQLV